MKTLEFSPWWIRNCCDKVNNKYRYSLQEKDITIIPKYTWINCYKKGRDKLSYRFNHSTFLTDEWKSAINYQLRKLYLNYDIIYLWGVKEFENLEKLNNADFEQDIFPGNIWKFKAIEKSAEANKTMKWIPKKNRTDKHNWEDIMANTNVKFRNETILSDEEQLWDLCFRANRDKVNKYFQYIDWSSRFKQNTRKLRRWK